MKIFAGGKDQSNTTYSSDECTLWQDGVNVAFPSSNALKPQPNFIFIGLKKDYGYWSVVLKTKIRFYYAIVEVGTAEDARRCLNVPGKHISACSSQLRLLFMF